jgi:hypothetical protein
MKKSLWFLLVSLISLSLSVGCNKKKDEKSASPGPEMGAAPVVAEMAPPAPGPDMKPVPEPVAAPVPPAPVLPSSPATLTALAELGTPLFAVHVELATVFDSPAFKATGLEDKLNAEMNDDKDFPQAAIGACLGIDLKRVTDLTTAVTVFGNKEEDIVILAKLPMEAEKMFGCLNQVSKGGKTRVAEEMFGTTKGYKVTARDGDVTHFVGVGRNMVLIIVGERKDLIAKLKIGEGHLGKGDVAGYFPGGPQAVKVVLRNLPLEKMNKEGGKVQIPNLKNGDLDGWVHVTDGVKLEAKLDTKDPKAAEALIAMGTIMKGLTQIKEEMKEIGMDPGLLDLIKLAATGNIASLSVELDAAKALALAGTIKKQLLDEVSSSGPKTEESAPASPK